MRSRRGWAFTSARRQRILVGRVWIVRKTQTASHQRDAVCLTLAFSLEIFLTVPAGAGTPAFLASAADIPAADHGLAIKEAQKKTAREAR